VTLSGNSCLGGDHLAKTSISEDPEHITFSERGSYEYSQINFFNGRFRPSVYLLEESGALTMVKEDTLEDLTGYWRESVPHFPEPYQSFPYFEEIARQESGLYLYHPKMRWVSSFELDPESFPAPASLARALFDNFASHSMTYGRSLGRVEVRDRIAAYENGIVGAPGFYNNANVGFTLGATSAFWLIINSFLIGKSRRLLIHCPTYYQYSFSASSYKIPWTHVHQREPFQLGHELVVPPERFLPSADDVIAAVGGAPDIGALVIANPGLPYGCKQKPDDVRRLAEKARAENWLLILDETLMELDPAGADESHWRWLDHSYPIVRIKSASKTFGLAGLRIGYFCVTDAVCTLFGSQDALFEKMGGLADTIYSAPPAVFGPVLAAALDLLEDRRAQRFDRQDVAQFQANLQKLRQNADRAGKILTEWNIPYVVPESGMNIMAFLPKLRNVKTDSIEFFRRLIREHSIFVDLGGMFSQNPAWNCTMARIGLGRPEQHFERDLIDLCRFHDAYDAPTADGARTRVMISSSVSTDEQLFA
jgi:aspartate/methionine/tyrosine aminotransferase